MAQSLTRQFGKPFKNSMIERKPQQATYGICNNIVPIGAALTKDIILS